MLVVATKTVRGPCHQDSAADAAGVTEADDGLPVAQDLAPVNDPNRVPPSLVQRPSTKSRVRYGLETGYGIMLVSVNTHLVRRGIR